MKRCTKCQETKGLEEFRERLDKPRKDGSRGVYRISTCKACESATNSAAAKAKVRLRRVGRKCKGCQQDIPMTRKAGTEFCSKNCQRRWRYANDPDYREYVHWQNKKNLNVEQRRERERRWRATPEGKATKQRIRYVRQVTGLATATLNSTQWKLLLLIHGHACAKCGSKNDITLDHIQPIAKQGTHTMRNAQPLCRSCNGQKSARHSTDYRRKVTVLWQPYGSEVSTVVWANV